MALVQQGYKVNNLLLILNVLEGALHKQTRQALREVQLVGKPSKPTQRHIGMRQKLGCKKIKWILEAQQ